MRRPFSNKLLPRKYLKNRKRGLKNNGSSAVMLDPDNILGGDAAN